MKLSQHKGALCELRYGSGLTTQAERIVVLILEPTDVGDVQALRDLEALVRHVVDAPAKTVAEAAAEWAERRRGEGP